MMVEIAMARVCPQLIINNFSAIFRSENYMILAHPFGMC